MLLRYISLLLLTGAVGVASGFLWLIPNGLMGGVLGICLSAGTIWLGIKQRHQGGNLTLRQVLGTGFVTGLLAGALMALVSETLTREPTGHHREMDFGPPMLPYWAPLIMGVLYGIAIHWSYHRRRFSSNPLRQTLFYACGTCFLLKMVGTFIYIGLTEKLHGEIVGALFGSAAMSLLGAVPFAFLWVLVTKSLDPAWSSPTWKCDEDKNTPEPPNV